MSTEDGSNKNNIDGNGTDKNSIDKEKTQEFLHKNGRDRKSTRLNSSHSV